nr:MAG: Protein of unknown function (DUF3199) [Bacteriophage sp.]
MVHEDVRKPYADFMYYRNDYGGVQIKNERDFKRMEKISEAFVEQVTFGRIATLVSITDSIRDAICCVADMVAVQNEKREAVVKSESNDGYSISYADAVNDTVLRNEMYRAVRSYLANTGLLYRGWVKEYDDKQ